MTGAQREERAGATPRSATIMRGGGRRIINSARSVFWLMFAINLINYLDRLLVVAVGPTLKADFHLTDRAIGLLGSAFLVIYTLSALPLGLLGDRVPSRARLIAVGVGAWSLFSGLTALARGFVGLFVTRALVGVGEASYYPSGTALLSAYFPRATRARVMGRWQAGQLIGMLMAFMFAGVLFSFVPSALAWRLAFAICALPGLALAALMWFVAEGPSGGPRPIPDDATSHAPAVPENEESLQHAPRSLRQQFALTLSIPTVWLVIALQAVLFVVSTPAITFLPIYVHSKEAPFHLSMAHGAFLSGGIIVIGGVLGAVLGGPLADALGRRYTGGRMLAIAVAYTLAAPFYAVMLLTHALPVFAATGTLAVLAINLSAGPLTAIPQDVAPPGLRATAVAATLLASHLLGDVWAPTAVGSIATTLHEHVGPALLIVGIPALLIGCVTGIFGARVYARNVRLADA